MALCTSRVQNLWYGGQGGCPNCKAHSKSFDPEVAQILLIDLWICAHTPLLLPWYSQQASSCAGLGTNRPELTVLHGAAARAWVCTTQRSTIFGMGICYYNSRHVAGI